MSKFQRRFRMTVQGKSGKTYEIKDPLTVIFDVYRLATGSANTGNFMIYNLSPSVRNDLQFDYAFGETPRPFTFSAGYISDGYMTDLYKGTVRQALSYREGPDVVTQINVLDGGQMMQKSQIERTRNYPWDPKKEVKEIVSTMGKYGVSLGAIGSLFKNFKNSRGITWIGSTWDVLKRFASHSNGYACVDLEKVYLLAQNDAIDFPGAIPQLDSSTGLIGTPRRSHFKVNAGMLFEPRMQLLQQLKVASKVNPNINGSYIVQSIKHSGTISAAKDGGASTNLLLINPPEGKNLVSLQQ